jgi:23S rRNA (adenine1618-N6)-methyltransferase
MTQKTNKRPASLSARTARPARPASTTASRSDRGPRSSGTGKTQDGRRPNERYAQEDRGQSGNRGARGEGGERGERAPRGEQRERWERSERGERSERPAAEPRGQRERERGGEFAPRNERPARGDSANRSAPPRQGERRSDAGRRPKPPARPEREPITPTAEQAADLEMLDAGTEAMSDAPARPAKPKAPPAPRATMHPDNPHLDGYDFEALCECRSSLKKYVITAPNGQPTIDFSKPAAVKALNRALLALHYGVQGWDLPTGYLCPPVPGRLDYLLHLADLLAEENDGEPPVGGLIRALDVGVGANAIYPLLGTVRLGWSFVGIDIDATALANARQILEANPQLADQIELREQPVPENIFLGALRGGEKFDVTLCNPPFHESLAEAEAGSRRKWNQLGKPKAAGNATQAPLLNFGGQVDELCCPGGERGFVQTMIEQSAGIAKRCLWFTTLLAKEANLPPIEKALKKARVADFRIIAMGQGQKQSRIIAWTFLHPAERQRWRRDRWAGLGR